MEPTDWKTEFYKKFVTNSGRISTPVYTTNALVAFISELLERVRGEQIKAVIKIVEKAGKGSASPGRTNAVYEITQAIEDQLTPKQ